MNHGLVGTPCMIQLSTPKKFNYKFHLIGGHTRLQVAIFWKKNENRTRIPLEVSIKKEEKTEEAFTSVSQCFCCSSNYIFNFHIAAFTYKLEVFYKSL